MGMQERTKKRIFTEICRAEDAALNNRMPGETSSEALSYAWACVAKNNKISIDLVKRIANEGVYRNWPEDTEEHEQEQVTN